MDPFPEDQRFDSAAIEYGTEKSDGHATPEWSFYDSNNGESPRSVLETRYGALSFPLPQNLAKKYTPALSFEQSPAVLVPTDISTCQSFDERRHKSAKRELFAPIKAAKLKAEDTQLNKMPLSRSFEPASNELDVHLTNNRSCLNAEKEALASPVKVSPIEDELLTAKDSPMEESRDEGYEISCILNEANLHCDDHDKSLPTVCNTPPVEDTTDLVACEDMSLVLIPGTEVICNDSSVEQSAFALSSDSLSDLMLGCQVELDSGEMLELYSGSFVEAPSRDESWFTANEKAETLLHAVLSISESHISTDASHSQCITEGAAPSQNDCHPTTESDTDDLPFEDCVCEAALESEEVAPHTHATVSVANSIQSEDAVGSKGSEPLSVIREEVSNVSVPAEVHIAFVETLDSPSQSKLTGKGELKTFDQTSSPVTLKALRNKFRGKSWRLTSPKKTERGLGLTSIMLPKDANGSIISKTESISSFGVSFDLDSVSANVKESTHIPPKPVEPRFFKKEKNRRLFVPIFRKKPPASLASKRDVPFGNSQDRGSVGDEKIAPFETVPDNKADNEFGKSFIACKKDTALTTTSQKDNILSTAKNEVSTLKGIVDAGGIDESVTNEKKKVESPFSLFKVFAGSKSRIYAPLRCPSSEESDTPNAAYDFRMIDTKASQCETELIANCTAVQNGDNTAVVEVAHTVSPVNTKSVAPTMAAEGTDGNTAPFVDDSVSSPILEANEEVKPKLVKSSWELDAAIRSQKRELALALSLAMKKAKRDKKLKKLLLKQQKEEEERLQALPSHPNNDEKDCTNSAAEPMPTSSKCTGCNLLPSWNEEEEDGQEFDNDYDHTATDDCSLQDNSQSSESHGGDSREDESVTSQMSTDEETAVSISSTDDESALTQRRSRDDDDETAERGGSRDEETVSTLNSTDNCVDYAGRTCGV